MSSFIFPWVESRLLGDRKPYSWRKPHSWAAEARPMAGLCTSGPWDHAPLQDLRLKLSGVIAQLANMAGSSGGSFQSGQLRCSLHSLGLFSDECVCVHTSQVSCIMVGVCTGNSQLETTPLKIFTLSRGD